MQKVMIERPATGIALVAASERSSVEIERPRETPQHDDPDQQADVARLGDPERLHRGARGGRPLIPEADQQVRAEADQLPAHEQLQQVRRQHESHHREREERLIDVVAAERRRRLVVQVAERVELDEQRHERDEAQHDRRLSRRPARPRRAIVLPPDGSHGHTSTRRGSATAWMRHAITADANAAARTRSRTTPRACRAGGTETRPQHQERQRRQQQA